MTKRIHKYLILLVNPFLFDAFLKVQNAPENPYKSGGGLYRLPLILPLILEQKISTF
jgi:hypothetical protein